MNWCIASGINVNYFLLQRSVDGKNFYDEAMVFPQAKNGSNKSFSYDDDINNMTSELVYYRLNAIDIKGHSKYSEVVVIRIEKDMQLAKMLVYPTPATKKVNIEIPESWQGRKISYSVYNLNGEAIKAFTNTKAGPTESFDLAGYSVGTYTVKINSGVNSSVIQFIKMNLK